jgi:transposase-like protein
VADVLIAVCDGLKGLPESINTVWEKTLVQTCVIHLLRKNLPVRRPPGLGRHRQRPAPDLHRGE